MEKLTLYKRNRGFTLVEVLVSLVLFSIGLLGIALQFSGGIQARVNNEVHSSVMQIAMQAAEPLNNAILIDNATFLNTLMNINNAGAAPTFDTNNSNLENFTIAVTQAVDGSLIPQNLFTTPLGSWQPPYTAVLMITYLGNNGTTLNFPTTHVFAPLSL